MADPVAYKGPFSVDSNGQLHWLSTNGSRALLDSAGGFVTANQVNEALAAALPGVLSVGGNADKLAQTGLVPLTIVVITGEGGRVEQYVPTGNPAVSGLRISGGTPADSAYTFSPGFGYPQLGGSYEIYPDGDGGWRIPGLLGGDAYVGSVATYPWQAVWSLGTATGSIPIVTENPIAGDSNWIVLVPTINLTVVSQTGDVSMADQYVSSASTTNLGWVNPLAIPYDVLSNGDIYLEDLYLGTDNTGPNHITQSKIIYGAGTFSLLDAVPRKSFCLVFTD